MPTPERVQPYKAENTAQGGKDADTLPFPTTVSPQEDALESAGLYIQDASNRDYNVLVYRSGDDLRLKDVTSGDLKLSDLTKVINFLLDNDPVRVTNTLTVTRTSGLVSQLVWRDGNSTRLKQVDITRSSGLVSSIVTRVYDTDGNTILAQKTETPTRSGGSITSLTSTRNV